MSEQRYFFVFYNTVTGDIQRCKTMTRAKAQQRCQELARWNTGCIEQRIENAEKWRVDVSQDPHVLVRKDPPAAFDHWASLRKQRTIALQNSDWTQGADSPLSNAKKAEWQTYRQALRDLPGDVTDPTSVTWPTKPS